MKRWEAVMTMNFPKPSLEMGSLELTEEYIRLRAYHFFEERGREHGHDLEDWLRAEEEILGFHKAGDAGQPQTRARVKAA
jgi:hypothetical protein